MVAHLTGGQGVAGSNPVVPTKGVSQVYDLRKYQIFTSFVVVFCNRSGKLETMTTEANHGGTGKHRVDTRLYQLKNGRWQAKKWIPHPDGLRDEKTGFAIGVRLTATANTMAEARKKLILKLNEGQLPQSRTKPSDTIDALLDAHLADLSTWTLQCNETR